METLKRYPFRQNDLLQAWDSADKLILQHVRSLDLIGKRILIINDQFGAISCGLQNFDITSYSDSFVSTQAMLMNSHQKIFISLNKKD